MHSTVDRRDRDSAERTTGTACAARAYCVIALGCIVSDMPSQLQALPACWVAAAGHLQPGCAFSSMAPGSCLCRLLIDFQGSRKTVCWVCMACWPQRLGKLPRARMGQLSAQPGVHILYVPILLLLRHCSRLNTKADCSHCLLVAEHPCPKLSSARQHAPAGPPPPPAAVLTCCRYQH